MTTPKPILDDDTPGEVPVDVLFQVSADGTTGWLVLAGVDGGDVLEIPLTREDAARLAAALSLYASPLRTARPAGHA